jgi:hypothetical protein
MSAALYGVRNAEREATPKDKSKGESYVDVVAALVPAEILAANALLLPLMVETTEESGKSVTEITDPGALELMFWLSIAASILFYLVAERTRAGQAARKRGAAVNAEVKPTSWAGWNLVRALIPAGAYVAWTMLQKSTAFDGLELDMSEGMRLTIAVFGAMVLAVIAKGLSDKADHADPPGPAPAGDPATGDPITDGGSVKEQRPGEATPR